MLDAGRVKEFDSPAGLLADKYFSFNLYLCCNLNLYLCSRVYLNLNFSKNILPVLETDYRRTVSLAGEKVSLFDYCVPFQAVIYRTKVQNHNSFSTF